MRTGRHISTLLLGASLLAPLALRADDDDHRHDKRYYDRDHKDYHEWNDREDRAYRKFLEERHEHYRDWNRINRDRQREYWRWRHDHPDNVLFRLDIR